MNRGATLQLIKERQRQWAKARGIAVSANDRVLRLEDNLFAPLNIETRAEIEEGDGDEFGNPDDVGKIYSLFSSSALVCNFFDYWRGRSLSPLICDIKFEQKFRTGVSPKPANLDVLFDSAHLSCLPTAIESKVTEPFQRRDRNCLKPA